MGNDCGSTGCAVGFGTSGPLFDSNQIILEQYSTVNLELRKVLTSKSLKNVNEKWPISKNDLHIY